MRKPAKRVPVNCYSCGKENVGTCKKSALPLYQNGSIQAFCDPCNQERQNVAAAKARYNPAPCYVEYDGFANASDALTFYNCD